MNQIISTLDRAPKLNPNLKRVSIQKPALLKKEHILFLESVFKNRTPCLTVYDRDLDGSTGLAGGVYASNAGTLHENWYHSYSWSKAETKGHTFGVSIDQIRHFYESKTIPFDSEVVIFTVDNGATASPVIKQAKIEYPNIKFFITDHHRSTDDTEEVADYFIDPTDEYIKGKNEWILFKDPETGEEFESHVSGGMLWNMILKEIRFLFRNYNQRELLKATKSEIEQRESILESIKSGDKSLPHQLLKELPISNNGKGPVIDKRPENEDFHTRVGLMSQYCDMITYGPDWEESFRVNLRNGNLQQLPIFKIVTDAVYSPINYQTGELELGMVSKNWIECFKEKIRQVSSIFNATKRLDFLLKNDEFERTLIATELNMEELDLIKLERITNENDPETLVEKLNSWNQVVKNELERNCPSVIVGELSHLKYVYLFGLLEIDKSSYRVLSKVIINLGLIKNGMLKLNKPQREETSQIQFFYTENSLMRGITSITCFIEKRLPVLFNLAPSGFDEGGNIMISGSYRSDIAEVFDLFNSKEFEYGRIRLAGHSKAAGATFTFNPENKNKFFEELNESVEGLISDLEIELMEREEITFNDILEAEKHILNNQNYYVFSEPLIFKIKTKDLIDNNKVKLKTAKTGKIYISHPIKGRKIDLLGFDMENIKDYEELTVEITVDPKASIPRIKVAINY